jgi:FAD synthase
VLAFVDVAGRKIGAFTPLHIDELLIVPFDKQLAEQSADEFVARVLVEKLRLKLLVAGPDFALEGPRRRCRCAASTRENSTVLKSLCWTRS